MSDKADCPRECDGVLVKSGNGWHTCSDCGNEVRSSVAMRIGSFKRVAERNTSASNIAAVALGIEKTHKKNAGIQW